MSHKLLRDARLYGLLLRIDQDVGAKWRSAGCPCGGKLHSARYRRKPRGGPKDLDPEYGWRLSYCCAEEGCRRRTTPPSVRFLGRRVFLGAVVVLISALMLGVTPARAARLRRVFEVSARTVERWRRWWRETFADGRFWAAAKARFVPPVESGRLPASLLERFEGDDERRRLVAALGFLDPLTTSSPSARGR